MKNQVVSTPYKLVSKFLGGSLLVSFMLTSGVSAHAMPQLVENRAGTVKNTTSQSPKQTAISQITTKTVALLVKPNGKLTQIGANTNLQKGSVIEYQTQLTNNNADRIRSMTVTMSIPDGLILLGGVTPHNASGSVDGRVFGLMPLRTVINGQEQDVPLRYYKNVRWDIKNLDVNQTAVVVYRAALL